MHACGFVGCSLRDFYLNSRHLIFLVDAKAVAVVLAVDVAAYVAFEVFADTKAVVVAEMIVAVAAVVAVERSSVEHLFVDKTSCNLVAVVHCHLCKNSNESDFVVAAAAVMYSYRVSFDRVDVSQRYRRAVKWHGH